MKLSKELTAMLTDIKAELDILLEKKRKEIMKNIYFDIIYDFHASDKYIRTHDWDPPYDHSGMLIKENKSFYADDYNTIGEFLDEYTGDSEAIYVSGCGLYYPNFGDYYSNEIEEKLCEVVHEFVMTIDTDIFEVMVAESGWQKEYNKTKENKGRFEIRDIAIEVADYYELIWDTFDKREKSMEEVRQSNFKYWYDILGDNVRKKVSHDKELKQQKYEADQLRMSKEKQKFSIVWEKLESEYFANHQEKIPKRIEAPQFSEFLKFLQQNNIKGDDFELIAKYAPVSFSNSVVDKLRCAASEETLAVSNKVNSKCDSVPMGETMLKRLFKFL